jgi:hypothetical protein
MKTNVRTLLREFPKIRTAALRGETVIVHTQEGDLRITADNNSQKSSLGFMSGVLLSCAEDLDKPTVQVIAWKASP